MNNYVNIDKLRAVGFDYDYTLVQYTNDLQHLIYNMVRVFLRASASASAIATVLWNVA